MSPGITSQRTWRPPLIGRNGAVGANHPLAMQAGLDVLREGGNAVDAAVAISLTLGVVEPHMSGLGGDGFYHVFVDGKSVVFNGCGTAPAAANAEAFAAGIDVTGPRSVSVPGSLGGIAAMHAAHGTKPWASLFRAAIEHAREGFGATPHYVNFAAEAQSKFEPAAAIYRAGAVADLLRNEALARSLEEIAADGAETFYRGRLARRIAGVGLITEADLAATAPEIQAPIAAGYRGYTVTQTPPNSTGFATLQMLLMLERFDLATLSPADRVHLMVEAKKRAFIDRERYGADPRFETVPVEMLLSSAHIDRHVDAISLERAAEPSLEGVGEAVTDTTYFAVVDVWGNAVSAIQSLNNAFGSGCMAGDTGILLNNRMAYWHLGARHPNRLMPGKRVRHTMNAPMIFENGKLWGILGTPGADNQVQVNFQVISALLDDGDHAQAAVERPRWTSSQPGQTANWPHSGDFTLTIEEGFGPAVLDDLARRGHRVNRVGALGGPCAMQVITLADNGMKIAGSDPRRDGWAGAY